MTTMRRTGRVSPIAILVVLGIFALVALLFFSTESPAATGTRFMNALAKGDVNTLTETSFVSGKSTEQLRQDWEFATQTAAKHYMFRWKVIEARTLDDDTGTMRVQVERNFGPGSYEENFGLQLRKIDSKWKVDAASISHEMYPGLPRPGKA